MGDNSAETSRNLRFAICFAVIGLLIGAPLSYFFQSESLRQGLGTYLAQFGHVLSNKDTAIRALLTMVSMALSAFLFGLFVAGIVSGLKGPKPNPPASKS